MPETFTVAYEFSHKEWSFRVGDVITPAKAEAYDLSGYDVANYVRRGNLITDIELAAAEVEAARLAAEAAAPVAEGAV